MIPTINNSILANLIIKLYKKICSVEKITNSLKEAIYEAVESNELANEENIPSWFLEFWKSILNQRPTEKIYFMTSEIIDTEGDIINFLAELSDIIEMNYNNYGEGITMEFVSLDIEAFICMEGGPGACFYQIKSTV